MSHSLFNGHQISTGFVKVKSEGVTKAVEIKTLLFKTGISQSFDKDFTYRFLADGRTITSREEPVLLFCTAVRRTDIGHKERIRSVRKNGKAVRSVLAAGYVDIFFCTVDIATVKTTELADPDTGRIQKSDFSFMLKIIDGINDLKNLIF